MLPKRDIGIRYSVQINGGCYSVAKNILPLAEYPIISSETVRGWISATFSGGGEIKAHPVGD